MSSWDIERQRKLNNEFDNIFREHERLQQDLNSDQTQHYESLLNSINKWEDDAIKKIQKTAKTARNDIEKLLKNTNQQLQRFVNNTITEELREALREKNKITEFNIDKWLVQLSQARKELENLSSTIEFSYNKSIKLIKVNQTHPTTNLDYRTFYFEKIRGRPILYNTEHVISSVRPTIVLSEKKYSTGTHYFRFRIEKNTDELFFGVISDKDHQNLIQNKHPIESIHGWWNIDRRVIAGRKDAHLSALNIYNGDEIVLILNCDAREIFLEYPSMTKLNSIRLVDDVRLCSPPWKVLVEIGKPGRCLLKLIDWGLRAQEANRTE
ncbi:unnamed protein product [Adineta steineri]|uniref:Uncharacterized protein n=1 Tax=Adineta steineri TaxID=433720 RepID=A0A814LA67_9BILA|nr:unnamed protein product [Adineta steineri]CAF1107684.1 unnamed protein product [Adineta steineri]